MKNTIKIKRPVVIKTIVTEQFKREALEELKKELSLLDSQILEMESQQRQFISRLDEISDQHSHPDFSFLKETTNGISEKLESLCLIRKNVYNQQESVDNLILGNVVVTGSLESFSELSEGDNIYEKFHESEIIVKDGIIQEIRNQ